MIQWKKREKALASWTTATCSVCFPMGVLVFALESSIFAETLEGRQREPILNACTSRGHPQRAGRQTKQNHTTVSPEWCKHFHANSGGWSANEDDSQVAHVAFRISSALLSSSGLTPASLAEARPGQVPRATASSKRLVVGSLSSATVSRACKISS